MLSLNERRIRVNKHTIYKTEIGRQAILDSYEAYINNLSTSFDRTYVNTRFGKTHVLVTGPENGKPVFVFQGGNCINPMTLAWFSALWKDYRIYAPDTIGHPGYSEEVRISAKDNSFALWIEDLMNFFQMEKSAFVGPSYGAGIILRLATFMPEKISCSVLVSPAGIKLGSKVDMIKKILVPLWMLTLTSKEKYLDKIADVMSENSMKSADKKIIGEVFKYVKLEQDMPKLTEKRELLHYQAPTLLIAGERDIFFPEKLVVKAAKEVIPNLVGAHVYNMGHFPSEECLTKINNRIKDFLNEYY